VEAELMAATDLDVEESTVRRFDHQIGAEPTADKADA
jgi:hypothetical protein